MTERTGQLIAEVEIGPVECYVQKLGVYSNKNEYSVIPLSTTHKIKARLKHISIKKNHHVALEITNKDTRSVSVEIRRGAILQDAGKISMCSIYTKLFLLTIVTPLSHTDTARALDGVAQAESFIKNITSTLVSMAGIVSVIFIIIGGFKYIISSGRPDKLEAAKRTLLYSGIGLVIVLAAYTLVSFIIGVAKSSFGS